MASVTQEIERLERRIEVLEIRLSDFEKTVNKILNLIQPKDEEK